MHSARRIGAAVACLPPEKVGSKKDARLLTDVVDAGEVRAWADINALGRIAVVYAVIPDTAHGRGLFLLGGSDATRNA